MPILAHLTKSPELIWECYSEEMRIGFLENNTPRGKETVHSAFHYIEFIDSRTGDPRDDKVTVLTTKGDNESISDQRIHGSPKPSRRSFCQHPTFLDAKIYPQGVPSLR